MMSLLPFSLVGCVVFRVLYFTPPHHLYARRLVVVGVVVDSGSSFSYILCRGRQRLKIPCQGTRPKERDGKCYYHPSLLSYTLHSIEIFLVDTIIFLCLNGVIVFAFLSICQSVNLSIFQSLRSAMLRGS